MEGYKILKHEYWVVCFVKNPRYKALSLEVLKTEIAIIIQNQNSLLLNIQYLQNFIPNKQNTIYKSTRIPKKLFEM